ncbi:MAG: alpha/beta hydrolase [Planctomycetota bacterium]
MTHTAVSERRLALPAREGVIDAPSITVRLFRASEPTHGTVVFLHGLGYTRRDYAFREASLVERGYHVAFYALRGHAGGHGTFSIRGCAEDLSRVLDALEGRLLQGGRKFAVVGHSTGALVALDAARRDERIGALSVISTITSLSDALDYVFRCGRAEECFWSLHRAAPADLDNARHYLARDWREGLRHALLTESHPLRFKCRYGLLRVENYEDFLMEVAASPNAVQFAPAIGVPTILFCGERDEIIDPQNTRILHDRLGQSGDAKRLLVLDANDHFLNEHWETVVVPRSLEFFQTHLDVPRPMRSR